MKCDRGTKTHHQITKQIRILYFVTSINQHHRFNNHWDPHSHDPPRCPRLNGPKYQQPTRDITNIIKDMDEDNSKVKIVIIGEAGVGKTSLMSKFVFDRFDDQLESTIGCDIQIKSMTIEGHEVDVQLWDTAGCERFQTMLPLYYRGTHGAILVYDVTRKDTFNKLRDWLLELENLTNHDAVVMIVGNKIDKTGRQVGKEQGNNYAKQRSALFIETSAKTSEGVSIAFEELLLKIMQTPGLLDKGDSGINIGDNRGSQSGGTCNWASNVLSSLWSSVVGSG